MPPPAAPVALMSSPGAESVAGAAALRDGLRDRGWKVDIVAPKATRRRRPRPDPRLVHFLSADHARSQLEANGSPGARTVVSFSAAETSVAGLDEPDYYRPVWEHAAALHFPDEAVRARALSRGCPPEKPNAVIPPFVDAAAFHPNGRRTPAQGEPARPLRVLCAGPLEWSGGYEHGLQALARARERGVALECRVVGDGAHLSALLFARHQLGLREEVGFEGAVTPEALREHMRWADVFLAPTVIDGLPAHVGDAGALGLCLVTADPGPLGGLELGGSVAITVARRDPDALAGALGALAADPARRARMGAAARDWALARFAVEDQLDALEDLYRRTESRPRHP